MGPIPYPDLDKLALRNKWMIDKATDDGLEFAMEEAKEGIEILDNLIDSIQKHGNYDLTDIADRVRDGEWRKFVKEV